MTEPAVTSAPIPTPAEEPSATGENPKLVPVGESIKYRRRAQQAEGQLESLQKQLDELRAELDGRADQLAEAEAQRDEARHQLRATETRSMADRALQQAGVVDLEAASVLLGRRVDLSQEDLDEDSIAGAVEQLLVDKPFLCRSGGSLPPGTATARDEENTPAARLTDVARQAAASGNRRDIAEYLRLKRAVGRG
ncbi:MAG: hypothetical protein ACOCWV_03105 [Planctomycetota bacterium]